uniref:RING-type domain-containing protein n=1 Tax=Kalanchoe fedtschenkoi TaxID=63787 RepID=A0A7N0VGN3_KALFE
MRIAEGGRGTMRQTRTSCYRESIRALEADVQHANALAAGLPTDHDGDIIQIRLSYSPFAPLLVRLIEWLDYSCTDRFPSYLGLLHILVYKVYVDGTPSLSSQDRKASLSEFYAVIYPSLMLLQEDIQALKSEEAAERYGVEQFTKHLEKDSMREDECTICMDSSNKIVLPSCAHSMCSNCFHDWLVHILCCTIDPQLFSFPALFSLPQHCWSLQELAVTDMPFLSGKPGEHRNRRLVGSDWHDRSHRHYHTG